MAKLYATLTRVYRSLFRLFILLVSKFSRYLSVIFLEISHLVAIENIETIDHVSIDGSVVKLRFLVPNPLTLWRVQTFSSKEPKTLSWIDEFGGNGTFLDIGSNIGLYSIYAALRYPKNRVICFEPSAFNQELFVRNLALNGVQNTITFANFPLSEKASTENLNFTSSTQGGALSSFGTSNYDHDGTKLATNFTYKTMGFSPDNLFDLGLVPADVRMIKLDVDGIENSILRGASKLLTLGTVASVLVEIDESKPMDSQSIFETLES